MNLPSSHQPKYLNQQEIEQSIAALSSADSVRLERVARVYADGTEWTAADLLQEAFLAALTRRQWRTDLSATVFLIGVMRSLAYAKRKSQRFDPIDSALADKVDSSDEQLEGLAGGELEDPSEILVASEELEKFVNALIAEFGDDSDVLIVINGRAAGDTPAQIRKALGMNQSQYETVCRRLLRGYQSKLKRREHE